MTIFRGLKIVFAAWMLLAFVDFTKAQCPSITFATSDPLFALSVCPGDQFTYSVAGQNLPAGGTIDWYIGIPPFNPYDGEGTQIGSSDINGGDAAPITPCAPCPSIIGGMIDGCAFGSSNEADNEFLLINSGGGFILDNFYIDLPIQNNDIGAENSDINTPGSICGYQTPNPTLMTSLQEEAGCSNSFVAVSPGDQIPPNALVILFPSAGQGYNMDLTALCNTGQTTYIVQSSCDRSIGAFSNSSSTGIRTYEIGLSSCGCTSGWTYDTDHPNLSSSDGAFVYNTQFGGSIYTNTGCSSPPVELTAPPPSPTVVDDFTYTFNDDFCGSMPSVIGIINPLPAFCPESQTFAFSYNVVCPVNAIPTTLSACDNGTGQGVFDLTSIIDTVNGNSGEVVSFYFLSNGTGQIFNTSAYPSFPTTIYARVGNTLGDCVGDLAEITLEVNGAQTANSASLTLCDDGSGSFSFDLTNAASTVNGSTTDVVNYYTDINTTTQVSDPTDFIISTNTTVYVTVGSDPCESDPETLDLIISAEEDVEITGTQSICPGESANLLVTFDSSDPPYDFTLLNDVDAPQDFTNIQTNPYTITVLPSATSTYTLSNATANGCATNEIGSATVTVFAEPTATIENDTTICEGESVTLEINFTGTAPFDFIYEIDGADQPAIQTNDNPYELTVNPSLSTVYTLDSLSDSQCTGMVNESVVVTVNTPPTASLSAAGTTCPNAAYDLIIDFTGNAPWTFTYTEDGDPQTEITTSDNPYTLSVTPTESTDYDLIDISSNDCSGTINSQTVTVTVHPEIQIDYLDNECNAVDQTYVVRFNITGGVAPFQVNGDAGTLNVSNEFVSDPIVSDTPFSFIIVDGNGCEITYLGNQTCSPCITDAGTMQNSPEPIPFCMGDQISVTHDGDETLDTDEILLFYLHDNPDNTLGTVYDIATSPTFSSLASFPVNTTLYISAVAGNENTDGTIDLLDPCLSIAAGTPIVIYELPNLIIGAPAYCEGEPILAQVGASGVAPYTFIYTANGGASQQIQFFGSDTTVLIPSIANPTFSSVSLADQNCTLEVANTLNFNISDTLEVNNVDTICANDISSYQIEIELLGLAPYNVVGNGGSFENNLFTSDPIPNGDTYLFEITDQNACNTIVISGSNTCILQCVGNLGEMDNTILNLCAEETAMADYDATTENIEVGDLIQYVIHTSNNSTLGTIILQQDSPNFPWNAGLYTIETTYYISAISGNNDGNGNVDLNDPCLLVNVGQPVIWQQPTAVFTSSDLDICAGACTELTIELTGTGNFSVDITATPGTTETVNSLLNQLTYTVCPDVQTTYTLDAVRAGNCTGIINTPASVTVTPQEELGNSTVNYICANDNSTYTADFEIIGGSPPYTLISGNGNLVGTTVTVNPTSNATASVFSIEDALGCTLEVTIFRNCACTIEAETLDTSNLLTACADETISAIILTPATSEMGDVIGYALHEGSGLILENVLQINADPTFSAPVGFVAGQTYYISALLAEDNGNGLPDLNDFCLSVSQGVPVSWYNEPTITIPENTSICEGECYDLTYALSGGGDYTLTLDVNGSLITEQVNTSQFSINICPNDFGISAGQSLNASVNSLVNPGCIADLSTINTNTQIAVLGETETLFQGLVCPDFSIEVGAEIFDIDNPVGQVILQTTGGCDSTVSVNLVYTEILEGEYNANLCTGGSFELGGVIFDESMPTGSVILENASLLGCDSTVNVNLSFSDNIIFELDTFVCTGSILDINGEIYDENNTSGTFTFEDGSYLGCDSTVNVTVQVFNSSSVDLTETYCEGTTITVGGEDFNSGNPTGLVTISGGSFNGCDSIINVDLTFLESGIGILDTVLCQGEVFLINGTEINQDNPMAEFIFAGMAANGCDSILQISASFDPLGISTINQSLSPGETLTVGTTVFDENNTNGTVILENASFNGCDSIVEVSINYNLDINARGEEPTCFGDTDGLIVIESFPASVPPFQLTINGIASGTFSNLPFTISNLEAGVYDIILSDANGNTGLTVVNVPTPLEYTLELGDNMRINLGGDTLLNAQTNMAEIAILEWSPIDSLNNPDSLRTIAAPTETTVYSLYLEDSLGCSISDFVTIFVNEERQVFIPQIFSPNDDGLNDFFTIYGGNQVVSIVSLQVFDRWGNQVFSGENMPPNVESMGWDGRHRDNILNTQVLVYAAEIEFIDGKIEIFKGDLTLLRR